MGDCGPQESLTQDSLITSIISNQVPPRQVLALASERSPSVQRGALWDIRQMLADLIMASMTPAQLRRRPPATATKARQLRPKPSKTAGLGGFPDDASSLLVPFPACLLTVPAPKSLSLIEGVIAKCQGFQQLLTFC